VIAATFGPVGAFSPERWIAGNPAVVSEGRVWGTGDGIIEDYFFATHPGRLGPSSPVGGKNDLSAPHPELCDKSCYELTCRARLECPPMAGIWHLSCDTCCTFAMIAADGVEPMATEIILQCNKIEVIIDNKNLLQQRVEHREAKDVVKVTKPPAKLVKPRQRSPTIQGSFEFDKK
jgi:hypothetical protein